MAPLARGNALLRAGGEAAEPGAALQIPEEHFAVVRAAGEELFAGRDGKRGDGVAMAAQDEERAAVAKLCDAHEAIRAAGDRKATERKQCLHAATRIVQDRSVPAVLGMPRPQWLAACGRDDK